MDDRRFDDLTRALAAGHSRRSLLRAMAGGVAGGLLAVTGARRGAAAANDVQICHKPGTPAQKSLGVAPAAVPAHLAHGDYANPAGCCAAGIAVCVDGAGSGTCCPAPSRCLADGTCCTPTTCAAEGKDCGSISDGCGESLECGACDAAACLACGDDNTCSSTCTAGRVCCGGGACGLPADASGCGADGDCCSGICDGPVCAPYGLACLPIGAPCNYLGGQCCSGNCVGGFCRGYGG